MERNRYLKAICGDRFLDLMALVIDAHGAVPVFTPDKHYNKLRLRTSYERRGYLF